MKHGGENVLSHISSKCELTLFVSIKCINPLPPDVVIMRTFKVSLQN